MFSFHLRFDVYLHGPNEIRARRVIVDHRRQLRPVPNIFDDCETCGGLGRIRDGETDELRRCLDCRGAGR